MDGRAPARTRSARCWECSRPQRWCSRSSPLANATAQAEISIASPSGGYVATHTPTFEGVTDDILDNVTLDIYAGPKRRPGSSLADRRAPFCRRPAAPGRSKRNRCPTARNTAQAGQTNTLGETSTSEPPVTFHVDTTKPEVSLDPVPSPTNDATPSLAGHSGTRCRRRRNGPPSTSTKVAPPPAAPVAHAVRDPDWRGVVDERRPGARRRHVQPLRPNSPTKPANTGNSTTSDVHRRHGPSRRVADPPSAARQRLVAQLRRRRGRRRRRHRRSYAEDLSRQHGIGHPDPHHDRHADRRELVGDARVGAW